MTYRITIQTKYIGPVYLTVPETELMERLAQLQALGLPVEVNIKD